MIAKTIKNTGSGSVANSVNYAQREGAYQKELSEEEKPAVILMNNLSDSDAKSVAQEFKMINETNKNIADNKKYIHEVVSFSKKDIEKLDTPEKRGKAVERYLEHKGISKDNFQYIAVEHKDTDNIHVHVIHNRVGIDGEVYKASGNYERSAVAQERTEKEFRLDNGIERKVIYAPEEERGYKKNPNYGKEVGIVKTPKNRRINDNREKDRVLTDKQKRIIINKEITNALSKSENSDLNKLKTALAEKGIALEDRYNKEEKLTGVKFIYKEHSATGTQVGYKANLITSKLNENQSLHIDKSDQQINSDSEKWKSVDKEINNRIENAIKKEEFSIGKMDEIIRQEVPKEFPKENVWAVVEKHGGARYQDKLMDKAENMQKEKPQKIEHEKPQIEQKEDKEYSRFQQNDNNRKEKEQEQEQNKGRGR
jgi:hypothetical protein